MSTSDFELLKAKAAVFLVELTHTQDGFICRQWAVTRRYQTLEQVEVWLEQFEDSAPHTVQPLAEKQGGEYAPPKE